MSDLYQLATRLRSFDPATVKTYRVDGQGVTIGGALVIQPDTTSSRARAILDYFRGESSSIDATPSGERGSSSTSSSTSTVDIDLDVDATLDDRRPSSGVQRPRSAGRTTTTLDASGRPPDLVSGVIPPGRPDLSLTASLGERIAGESPADGLKHPEELGEDLGDRRRAAEPGHTSPRLPASRSASSRSPAGRHHHQLVQPPRRCDHVARHGRPAVRQQHRHLPGRPRPRRAARPPPAAPAPGRSCRSPAASAGPAPPARAPGTRSWLLTATTSRPKASTL